MYGNDVRRTLILGQYGTAVRSERNCSENTNVYGVRPFTKSLDKSCNNVHLILSFSVGYKTESTLNYFGGFFKIVPKIWI